MKTKTAAAEPTMAIMPWRIESAPSEGPTVRYSRIVTGAARAPARSTMARSRASSTVNWPVMTARPPGIRSLMRGAEYRVPSRMMARRRPTFCSVTSPKMRAPVAVNSMATCQLPGEFGSACTSARVSSAPVSSVRFCTTYGTLRSTLVSFSVRGWYRISEPSGSRPASACSGEVCSSSRRNSGSAVLPISALARSGSCTPGSWMRMRSVPWRVIVGSATPNWSTRLRMVSTPWRTASSRSCATTRSRMTSVNRPAFSSRSRTSKLLNSAATVSASFQFDALASSTTIDDKPSRATRLTPTPLRSRPFLRSSAARSVWLLTCLSASTPRTRWMPPCRSRPRLIRCLGGYRYQIERASTTATTPRRRPRFLGILVACTLHDAADRAAIELELHLVGHPQRDRVLAQAGDGAVQPTGGDDPIATLQRRQHALALRLLALLGPDDDEVEDGEHRTEQQEGLQKRHRPAGAAGRRGGGVREVGRVREAHPGKDLPTVDV